MRLRDRFWMWVGDRISAARPEFVESDQPEIATSPSEPSEEDVRTLMGHALSSPTPEAVMSFASAAQRLRRLAAYNVYMVYAQRPGAAAVASRDEWRKVNQEVLPDAIPILILRRFGPIEQVFELADTVPYQERDPREHIFGARGPFSNEQLFGLIEGLGDPKRKLKVDICFEDFGGLLAGKVTASKLFSTEGPSSDAPLTGELAHSNAATDRYGKKLAWRIKLNRRMTAPEQYATLTHELGHIFCGHVGPYDASNPDQDEYGWRDRSQLDHSTKEIEAELVSWLACERADLITGAPLYLKPHLEAADAQGLLAKVDLDIVIRALARIEAHGGGRTKRRPLKQRSSSASRARTSPQVIQLEANG